MLRPGEAYEQKVTKAGGAIVAWYFWSSLFGDSRKFVASSSKVLETYSGTVWAKNQHFEKQSQKTLRSEGF